MGHDSLNNTLGLFIERALWFGKQQKMTVSRFLDWFTSYLAVEDREFILAALPFFKEEHKKVEKILCSLLEEDFHNRKKNSYCKFENYT